MRTFSEMDAGEQGEFISRRIAFTNSSSEDIDRWIRILARRIHSPTAQVKKDVYRDARILSSEVIKGGK